ncbi:O-antigen ligase family protein [Candidatus Magnetaquicoccus inordinatus]|uniref:O-antigen ligase family protein n=1 Tax=Candidatus Magnetaquicoccus inordinatus TaxID=2496818 RepID=UPI00102C1201|nr:O-antigen ligase family protein [Candidatus Magnetaquicoccus inordinatus]
MSPALSIPVGPLQKPSLGVRYAGFYFFLVFAVWPLTIPIFPVGSLESRFPLLVGVAMIFVAIRDGRKLSQIRIPAQYFFIFCLFYVLSSIEGPEAPGLVEGVISLLRSVGLGVALVLSIRTVADLQFFLRVYVWYGIASTLYGLLFMVPGLMGIGGTLLAMGLPPGKDPGAMRMTGLLTDPTYFGLSVMPALLITLHQVMSSGFRNNRFHYWLVVTYTALLSMGIILSFSRTTWAGVAAGILLLTGMQRKILRTFFSFLFILLFLHMAAPDELLEVALSDNADRTTIELNERNDSRSGIWMAYFELAMANPLGYGLGSIEYLRQLPTTFSGMWARESPRPHNIYLFIWVESGLQTVLPLLGLLGISFMRCWKIRHLIDPMTGQYYGALGMALLTAMTIGLFGLGGMLQLLSINISLGLAIWYLGVEKKLLRPL